MTELLDIHLWGFSLSKPLHILIQFLLIGFVTQTAVSVVKFLFRRAGHKQTRAFLDQTTANYIQRIIVYAIYIVGMASFLPNIPGMEAVGHSILAGAGIMVMAVGLASKEALANFIGGLFIVFGKPFRIGDSIKIDEEITGTVTEITLRHTAIRNAENKVIIVPNSKMNSDTIINATAGGGLNICSFVEVGVSYNTDLNKAMDFMRSEIMKHPLLIDHRSADERGNNVPQVIIRVMNLGDFAITLRAWAWAQDAGSAFALKCDSLKSIKERFDAEGVEIPYPYSNVHVKTVQTLKG